MNQKLSLDTNQILECRTFAEHISGEIIETIKGHTTVTVERTLARLLNIDGVDSQGIPLPNIVSDQLKSAGKLGDGAFYHLGCIAAATGKSPREIAYDLGQGQYLIDDFPTRPIEEINSIMAPFIQEGLNKIDIARESRSQLSEEFPKGPTPWLYVIVATGNIYEDTIQAQAAARQGADIIAVIRTTAQSLLDYVPYGPTTEGFGGTYATQENFRIMRKALNEVIRETGHYVQLVNYCSGLCMPEIAVTGAFEGLDMMLNDAMYGILFRDINMHRTFIDQHFSRMINAYSNIIINTGEDNYLTTSDAVEEAHTVLASQFINEALALRSHMPKGLMGLGHAFEIDPDKENGFLFEIAQAQMVRQIFPDHPIKYMPPTKYMNGNIFRGQVMNGMFNLASVMTDQSIQLLGMITEAVHTPFIQDRALAIENAKYVFSTARNLSQEITFTPGGLIESRAKQVLKETHTMLGDISRKGLLQAIEEGSFADIKRSRSGGKGAHGVAKTSEVYQNPFQTLMQERLEARI